MCVAFVFFLSCFIAEMFPLFEIKIQVCLTVAFIYLHNSTIPYNVQFPSHEYTIMNSAICTNACDETDHIPVRTESVAHIDLNIAYSRVHVTISNTLEPFFSWTAPSPSPFPSLFSFFLNSKANVTIETWRVLLSWAVLNLHPTPLELTVRRSKINEICDRSRNKSLRWEHSSVRENSLH
jgi:hypothetical protein